MTETTVRKSYDASTYCIGKLPLELGENGLKLQTYLAIDLRPDHPYQAAHVYGQFEAYGWRQAARIRDALYPGCRLALVTAED